MKRKKCFFSITQYVPSLVISKVPQHHPESHEISNAKVCPSEINQHGIGALPLEMQSAAEVGNSGVQLQAGMTRNLFFLHGVW